MMPKLVGGVTGTISAGITTEIPRRMFVFEQTPASPVDYSSRHSLLETDDCILWLLRQEW